MNRLCKIFILIFLFDIIKSQSNSTFQNENENLSDTLFFEFLPVEVEGFLNNTNNINIPAAITTLTNKDLSFGQKTLSLGESFRSVPGVFLMNDENFAQDTRISIRGFGSRSAFGIRGIKLLVDGFPQTTPDGQSQLDNIDIGFLQNAEIFRGSSSSIYGNAAGGVISFKSEPFPDKFLLKSNFVIAQNNFNKIQTTIGNITNRFKYLINLSSTSYLGYRDHSKMKTNNLIMKSEYQLNTNSKIGLHFNFVNSPLSQDPGSLNIEQVALNRMAARQQNIQYDSGEKVFQNRIGISYAVSLSNTSDFEIKSFITNRDFSNKLPFEGGGQVDLDRSFWGVISKYKSNLNLFNIPGSLIVGFEMANQSDRRKRFDNLFGDRGSKVFDQIESFNNTAIFFQHAIFFNNSISSIFGMRWDKNKIESTDYYFLDGVGSGFSDLKNTSPFFGIVFSFSERSKAYVNISNHYETPTLNELSNDPNPLSIGGFNPDLESQVSNSFEFGTKGYIGGSFSWDLSYFNSKVQNEIVPFEIIGKPGKTFYKNVGSTIRDGIEVSSSIKLLKYLRLDISYTYSDFIYSTYQKEDLSLNENKLPGIPLNYFHSDFSYLNPGGYYAIFSTSYVGKIFLDDMNEDFTKPYTVSNLRVGKNIDYKNIQMKPYFGINNMLDEKFNSNIRINAWGGRYYEPAPGVNIHCGIELLFK